MIRKFIENHLVNSAKNTMLDVIENTNDIEFLRTEFTKTLKEKWELEQERDKYKSIVEELRTDGELFIHNLEYEEDDYIEGQVETYRVVLNKIKELEEGVDNDIK